MRLVDGVRSGWFAVEQSLRQGCVLAPLLFNIFFTTIINVSCTRFKADEDIMNALVHLNKKTGARLRVEATAGKQALATSLWSILYADDIGVASQSTEQLRKMVVVIVVVWAAFGLTFSDAKTEIMCSRTKGMSEVPAIFSADADGQI